MSDEAKVECRTPNPGKPGVTRIPAWKFDTVRAAIIDTLSAGDVAFSELPARVAARLSDAERSKLGSVGWHTTSVKLEMEVRGEIERVPGISPQMLRLVARS